MNSYHLLLEIHSQAVSHTDLQKKALRLKSNAVTRLERWASKTFASWKHRTSVALDRLVFHANTLLLFTRTDIKSLLIPCLVFALVHEHCFSVFGLPPPSLSPTLAPFTRMLFRTIFWIWIILLPYDIDNQRMPDSIKQDSLNRPWRPLPSTRLTPEQATELMWTVYHITFATTMYLGGFKQFVGIAITAYLYNHRGFSDFNCWVRNATIVPGYLFFFWGATEVAMGRPLDVVSSKVWIWFLIIGGMIFTTVHALDMADQEGDKSSGRSTVPLVIGDVNARIMIAASTLLWSWIVPAFFELALLARVPWLLLGGLIAVRTLTRRDRTADKKTMKYWQAWTALVYLTPLVKYLCSAL